MMLSLKERGVWLGCKRKMLVDFSTSFKRHDCHSFKSKILLNFSPFLLQVSQTWDSSKSRSTGDSGRGDRRGDGVDSSGARSGFSVPPSSLSRSRASPGGSSAVVSSSPGLSLMLEGGGGRGGGGGGPEVGAVLSTGRGGGTGEEVRDRGRGEQVRDGGDGVEGREVEGGGERLLRSPHCSLFSLLLLFEGT